MRKNVGKKRKKIERLRGSYKYEFSQMIKGVNGVLKRPITRKKFGRERRKARISRIQEKI